MDYLTLFLLHQGTGKPESQGLYIKTKYVINSGRLLPLRIQKFQTHSGGERVVRGGKSRHAALTEAVWAREVAPTHRHTECWRACELERHCATLGARQRVRRPTAQYHRADKHHLPTRDASYISAPETDLPTLVRFEKLGLREAIDSMNRQKMVFST